MSDVRELKPEPVEIKLIDPRRTSLMPAAEPKRFDPVPIRQKRREHLPRWLIRVLAALLTINMLQWVIIYVLQAGPV